MACVANTRAVFYLVRAPTCLVCGIAVSSPAAAIRQVFCRADTFLLGHTGRSAVHLQRGQVQQQQQQQQHQWRQQQRQQQRLLCPRWMRTYAA